MEKSTERITEGGGRYQSVDERVQIANYKSSSSDLSLRSRAVASMQARVVSENETRVSNSTGHEQRVVLARLAAAF